MRINSITVKLLMIMATSFMVAAVGVLVPADIQLKMILDQSQEAVYKERIDTIIGFLRRNNERLKKTGLVEAYADDFKHSAIKFLRESHYKTPIKSIYPFILDTDASVVMHPDLPAGDRSLETTSIARQMLSRNEGKFEAGHSGQTRWYYYRSFEEWGWVIAYQVPLTIKYRDAHAFRNTLAVILGGVSVSVLLILALVVKRFTRPIARLTEASKQIANGNLSHPVDIIGNDEVGVLARSFLQMRNAIQQQIQTLNSEISERKQAEKALQKSESRLSEAQKLAGLGYWEWNVNTGNVEWSEEVYNLFRLNPSEFTPHIDSIAKLSPWPEYDKWHETLMQQAIKKRQKGAFDQKFLRPDGSVGFYHSTFKGKYDPNDNLVSIEGTVFDITERKQQESELRQLRNYLSNIINSMPFLLVGVDAEGTITHWNREAEKVTGRIADEVVGTALDTAIPRLSTEMGRIRLAIRTRQEQADPKRSRLEDGELVYEDLTVYPLIANGVGGAVVRIDDVTEQVRMEEMIIQSEKMLSVGGLAAGMAHEINNPLAGMIQTAQVLANRLDTKRTIKANEKAAEAAGTTMQAIGTFMEARGVPSMIGTIVESGQRVADIVSNMLSFARKGESQVSTQSLADLVDKTLELAATDYDLKKQYDFKLIDIVKAYDETLPGVPCESAKIQQVLLNILRNGAQAMQENQIDVPRFIIRTYAEESQQMVCLEIEDNGPGMDDATRKRVFEPFFTTKPAGEGTGLGLSVSYFIITENHNGQMNVDSTPGKGTTFYIRLPMAGPS